MAERIRALSQPIRLCAIVDVLARCSPASRAVGELQGPGNPADAGRQGESHRADAQNARWKARSLRDLAQRPRGLRQSRPGFEAGRDSDAAVGGSPGEGEPDQPAQERSDGRLHAARRSSSRPGREPRHAAPLQGGADARAGGASCTKPPRTRRSGRCSSTAVRTPTDTQPTWLGYSIGRWEGDTLVVDTTGFNGRAWVDTGVGPPADRRGARDRALHAARRRAHGHRHHDRRSQGVREALDTRRVPVNLLPDSDLIETFCENEKDVNRMFREPLTPNR